MVGIACPFPDEGHAIEDIVVHDVDDAEGGVSDVCEEYGASEIFWFFVVPADEEVAVYLAHADAEEVRRRDGFFDCTKECGVETE